MKRFAGVVCSLIVLLALSSSPPTYSIDESPEKSLPEMTDATDNVDYHHVLNGPCDTACADLSIADQPATETRLHSFAECGQRDKSHLFNSLLPLRI